MSGHGLLHLRYRPSADVVAAEVELRGLPALGTRRTTDDVDVTLDWTSTPEGELLTGFSLVHCRSRLDALTASGGPLPGRVADAVRDLVRSASSADPAAESHAVAFTHRFARTVEIPFAELRRPEAGMRPTGTAAAARELADAAEGFAHALRTTDPDPSDRTIALLDALQEWGEAIGAGGGSRASGALHEAQRAVRGGLPLTDQERRRLGDLLRLGENPAAWTEVSAGLRDLARGIAS